MFKLFIPKQRVYMPFGTVNNVPPQVSTSSAPIEKQGNEGDNNNLLLMIAALSAADAIKGILKEKAPAYAASDNPLIPVGGKVLPIHTLPNSTFYHLSGVVEAIHKMHQVLDTLT